MGALLPGAGLMAALSATPAAAKPPSPALLRRTWRAYDRRFVQDDGRVIDRSDNDITTSEGQAYALIRAAWVDDRPTFDRVLQWTRDNLQEGDPTALPAWRWGQRDDGTWGVLDPSPAADADVWMAYALLTAANTWDPSYADQAAGLLDAIWEQEVAEVGPWLLLLPGPWARGDHPVPLNPSYWVFPAFRAFAQADPEHDWARVLDHSYALLGTWMSAGRLPPDWVHVDPRSGVRLPDPPSRPQADRFGFEAMRIPLTLAADVAWHDETRARRLLVAFADLGKLWLADGRLAAVSHADGAPAVDYEYLGLYGALLPAWAVARPSSAQPLYDRHLAPALSRRLWGDPDNYYAQNLVWKGVAIWTGVARPAGALP